MDKTTIREAIRTSVEKEVNGPISLLKIVIDMKNEEQFLDVIKEIIGERYDLSPSDIKEIFFDITSDTFFTKEEIEILKNNAIEGNNNSFVSNIQLLKYFSPEKLDIEQLNNILGKRINIGLFSLIKKWMTELPLVFETLNIDMLDNDIFSILGSNYEQVILYESTQKEVLSVLKNETKRKIFLAISDNKRNLSPSEIETICQKINYLEQINPNFINLLSLIEKTQLSSLNIAFFINNPDKTLDIHNLDQFKNYEQTENKKYDELIKNSDVNQTKELIFKRLYKKNLVEIEDLIRNYGDDIEKLEKIEDDPLLKKYVTQMVQIKKIYYSTNLEELEYYYVYNKNFNYNSLEINVNLEKNLVISFNKTIIHAINQNEPNKEIIEDNSELGYRIVKISGNYTKMVSVMDAYGESNQKIPMIEKIHGPLSKINHARCYSMISSENLGIHDSGYNDKAVIIQVKDINENSITAASNKDIGSSSARNISSYNSVYYTIGSGYPNKTRDGYSEFVIENEKEDKITEVESLLCLDKVNSESINTAVELSKLYNRVIDIEIIDTKELIWNHFSYMNDEYKAFLETLDVTRLINYIRQYLNDVSAFSKIEKYSELFGDDGIFNCITNYNAISEATKLIKDDDLSMKKFYEYINKERKIHSLVTTIYDVASLDNVRIR